MGRTQVDLREINVIGERTQERLVASRACPELAPHGLMTVGISAAEQGFRFVRQRPTMAQSLACIAGSGRVLVDGDWRTLGPGESYLTPFGQRHAYAANGPWLVAWAHIAPDQQQRYGLDPDGPRVVAGPTAELELLLRALDRELLGRNETSARSAWVALLALHLRRLGGGDRDADRLQALWQQVSRDLAQAWTVADLARLAEVSGEHLRRLCQARLGTSPLRHLTSLRCEHAAALLQATDLPVAAIAEAVGYANPFAFSTAFRRWAGASPSAFRAG
jgi:AraC-like DNA-binding protein/quercetin dioxygenase-like cupin family protein